VCGCVGVGVGVFVCVRECANCYKHILKHYHHLRQYLARLNAFRQHDKLTKQPSTKIQMAWRSKLDRLCYLKTISPAKPSSPVTHVT
jgi:hypothetical protein